jgi:hypothetical protein
MMVVGPSVENGSGGWDVVTRGAALHLELFFAAGSGQIENVVAARSRAGAVTPAGRIQTGGKLLAPAGGRGSFVLALQAGVCAIRPAGRPAEPDGERFTDNKHFFLLLASHRPDQCAPERTLV